MLIFDTKKDMIKFVYGLPEVEFTPPHQPTEMLIKDFEALTAITNDTSRGELDRFLSAFDCLGVPADIVDQMSKDQFITNAKLLRAAKYDDALPPNEVEVGGRKYVANITDELNLSARDVVAIEKVAKAHGKQFPSMVMAIVYKDVELSNTEHYTEAHIKHKASLFRGAFSCQYAIPLLVRISKETVKDLAEIQQEDV